MFRFLLYCAANLTLLPFLYAPDLFWLERLGTLRTNSWDFRACTPALSIAFTLSTQWWLWCKICNNMVHLYIVIISHIHLFFFFTFCTYIDGRLNRKAWVITCNLRRLQWPSPCHSLPTVLTAISWKTQWIRQMLMFSFKRKVKQRKMQVERVYRKPWVARGSSNDPVILILTPCTNVMTLLEEKQLYYRGLIHHTWKG